ncbi:MAG: putative signal transducing protein [Acidobacteriota bacterium]
MGYEVYEKMAVALRTASDVEARVVAALLDGYRIPCLITGSLPYSIYPLGFRDTNLLVPESQLAEAESLIRSHRAQLRLVYSRGRDF